MSKTIAIRWSDEEREPVAVPEVDESSANCARSRDGEHEGYWINRKAGTFRCFHCGYQFQREAMTRPTPLDRIEFWNAS